MTEKEMNAELAVTIEETVDITEELLEDIENHDFEINNLVITLLNLDESEPALADNCKKINYKEHRVFFEFFYEHISNTRNGKKTRESKFLDNDVALLTKIAKYKENENDQSFLDFSNDITNLLFSIMKSSSKSSGSFFILDVIYNDEDYIFIIKLDPKDGVQLNPETLELNKIENMLPNSKDRVHKCALIKKNYTPNQTNLFVLDLQQRANETSQFFMESFLQAKAVPNNKLKTTSFITELMEKLPEMLPELTPQEINNAIEEEIQNGATINVSDTTHHIYDKLVPKDKIDRDVFIEKCESEFTSDYSRKYKDFGLSMVVDRDDTKVKFRTRNNSINFKFNKVLENETVIIDDQQNVTYITIHKTAENDFKRIFN